MANGKQKPDRLRSLKKVGIDPEALDWKDIKQDGTPGKAPGDTEATITPSTAIDQARQIVARAFSVKPSAVRISVDV